MSYYKQLLSPVHAEEYIKRESRRNVLWEEARPVFLGVCSKSRECKRAIYSVGIWLADASAFAELLFLSGRSLCVAGSKVLCSVFTPLTVVSFGTGGSGWLSYDIVGARSWGKANRGGLGTSVSQISWFWPLPRAVTVKPLAATESSLDQFRKPNILP